MMDAAERTGNFLTVHQNRRWDEDFWTVKKILEEGKLGEVFRIESRVHGSRGIPGDWRQEKEHGGGMVLDWGVHLLDQAMLDVYKRQAINRLRYEKPNMQSCLRTENAIENYLHFEGSEQI